MSETGPRERRVRDLLGRPVDSFPGSWRRLGISSFRGLANGRPQATPAVTASGLTGFDKLALPHLTAAILSFATNGSRGPIQLIAPPFAPPFAFRCLGRAWIYWDSSTDRPVDEREGRSPARPRQLESGGAAGSGIVRFSHSVAAGVVFPDSSQLPSTW